jgi:hypothetical protein
VHGPEGSGNDAPEAPSARQSLYVRLLVPAAVGVAIWWALPGVPHDQTVIFALGEHSDRVSQLEVHWEKVGSDHSGQLTLNFPSAPAATKPAIQTTSSPLVATRETPTNVVRQFRLADGEYSFRVSARRADVSNERTEVTRQVTLDGNTLILRLEELTR